MIMNSAAFYVENSSVDLICVINVIETGRWEIRSSPWYVRIVSYMRFHFRNCKKKYNKIYISPKCIVYYPNNIWYTPISKLWTVLLSTDIGISTVPCGKLHLTLKYFLYSTVCEVLLYYFLWISSDVKC